MTTMIGSTEAAKTLGVTKPTLYAYVSRGLVDRHVAVDGRTSLYDRQQVEALANRRQGRRAPTERPSLDVQIATGITLLDDDSPRYRGHRVLDLIGEHHFEEVADLLLTGALDGAPGHWRTPKGATDHAIDVVSAAQVTDPLTALAIAALTLSSTGPDERPDSAVGTARTLIALAPSLYGGPRRGSVAERLTRAWVRSPSTEVVEAIDTALILLADHELATSTLAVRVAASVRTEPAAALATGLNAVAGTYHGAASRAVAGLIADAAAVGAAAAVTARLERGERLPGFGHTVYRTRDPRFAPLLERVRSIPGRDEQIALIDDIVRESGYRVGHVPNIDLALGALHYVAELPDDSPIFAVARVAGWAAHYDEELGERPVRFRGLAKPR